MKIREIITVQKWVDGSGFAYGSGIEDQTFDVECIPDEIDWDWWVIDDVVDGEDYLITVCYYAADDKALEHLLAKFEAWESDLVEA